MRAGRLLVVLGLILVGGLQQVTLAAAATVDEIGAVTISPAIVDESIAPGASIVQDVTVGNTTKQQQRIAVELRDVTPGRGSSGSIDVAANLDGDDEIRSWISVDTASFVLPAGQRRILKLRITVPSGAPAGTRSGALVVRVLPTRSQVVAVTTEVVQLILVGVAGPAARADVSARLVPAQRVTVRDPLQWKLAVRNNGNLHQSITGQLTVAGVGTHVRTAVKPMILLPGTTRTVRITTRHSGRPDRLVASVQLRSAQSEDVVARAVAPPVWVTPWWLPLAVLLLMSVLAWRIRALQRRAADDMRTDDGSDGPFDSELA